MNSETKNCQNCKNDFIIESEDFAFYEKINVPPPTFCFHCRLQRKLAYINERTLFKHICNSCKKTVVSVYSPQKPYIVYCTDCYNSNSRDELGSGIDYDFSQSFFEQFNDLFKTIPHLHLIHKNNNAEGCEYANYTYKSRNAYLTFSAVGSEDIYYCRQVMKGNKICLDSMNILENERGYEIIDSSGNYNCRFLVRSTQCVDSSFLLNCKNCTNCCLSSNQQNKSYVFRNKQLTRDEYLKNISLLKLDTYSGQEASKEEFLILARDTICRFAMIKNSPDSSGNFLENCNNVRYSFDTIKSENSKYIVLEVNKMSDSYDLFYTGKMELCYEVSNAGAVDYKVVFSLDIGNCQDSFYSISCNSCKDIFGCVGLNNKQYCILNKQYTKEEYEELLPKIISQMSEIPYIDKKGISYKFGEFFPIELSPFAYNESLAYEEFPLSLAEVMNEGYSWATQEEKHHTTTIHASLLPDAIGEVDDTILEEVIACPNKGDVATQCTYAYRIVPEELRFYRLMNIPIPRYCPNCRYHQRRKWKLPWKLWDRQCMCDLSGHFHDGHCQIKFETPYAPDRPEKVFCERCYQQEVI